jgi:hypothetical protein
VCVGWGPHWVAAAAAAAGSFTSFCCWFPLLLTYSLPYPLSPQRNARQANVAGFVALAGPFGGAVDALGAILGGQLRLGVVSPLPADVVQGLGAGQPGALALLPYEEAFGSKEPMLLRTGSSGRNYSAAELAALLSDAGDAQGVSALNDTSVCVCGDVLAVGCSIIDGAAAMLCTGALNTLGTHAPHTCPAHMPRTHAPAPHTCTCTARRRRYSPRHTLHRPSQQPHWSCLCTASMALAAQQPAPGHWRDPCGHHGGVRQCCVLLAGDVVMES